MERLIQPRKAYFWVVILTLLYVARDTLALPIPSIIFTVICFISFIFTDIQDSLNIIVFTSVLTLPGNEIRLVYIIVYLIKRKCKLTHLAWADCSIVGALLLEFINIIILSNASLGDIAYRYITFSLFLVIPIIWYKSIYDVDRLFDAIKFFTFGIVLVAVITVFMTVRVKGWAILINGTNSLGMGLNDYVTASSMTTAVNRNTLGILACVGISLLMILLDQHMIKRVIGGLGIVLCLFVILTTRSRTAFLLVGILLVYWILLVAFRREQGIKGIVMVCIVVVGILALRYYFSDAWNSVINRFINQEDITNGRSSLNSQYLEMWGHDLRSVLFGYGVTSYNDYLRIINSPHNMLVDILICWGIAGILLLGTWLAFFFKQSMKGIEKEKISIAILPAFIMLVGLMMGQYLTVPTNHLYLCFLIMSISAFKSCDRRE